MEYVLRIQLNFLKIPRGRIWKNYIPVLFVFLNICKISVLRKEKKHVKCDKIDNMSNMIRFICGWIRVIIKVSGPSGVKSLAAENIALRQQLITLSRQYKRSPKLTTSDRVLFCLVFSADGLPQNAYQK